MSMNTQNLQKRKTQLENEERIFTDEQTHLSRTKPTNEFLQVPAQRNGSAAGRAGEIPLHDRAFAGEESIPSGRSPVRWSRCWA